MKLIVGLGNPGKIYQDSRHNIGFTLIKNLAQDHRAKPVRNRGSYSLISKFKIKGYDVILAMPLTFMNLSGNAVGALIKKYKIDLSNLLVVCDDLDLEFGRMKIRASGSSGGHRGLESIITSLKSQDFARLRIGIGRHQAKRQIAEYVLSSFNNMEKKQLREIIERARSCCESWINEGMAKSMNIFNRRTKRKS